MLNAIFELQLIGFKNTLTFFFRKNFSQSLEDLPVYESINQHDIF